MTPLFSGLVLEADGRSTWVADSTATDAVTMKIISRTRKMSVSGVMFISQNIPPSPLGVLTAIGFPPGERGVDQAGSADMNGGVDALDALREIIVEDHCDDGDDESEGGGDQG